MKISALNQTTPFFERGKVKIAVFLTTVFLYWASLYLYVPTLPVILENKIGDFGQVGIVLAMYGLLQAIVRLPVGIASDWFGRRKPFILVGLLLSAVGAILLGYADGFVGLAAGRAVTGLAAATWVPLVVAFSTLFKPEDAVRATAILSVVSSVSRMLSTGLTGTLNNSGGYTLPFLLAGAAAVLAFLVTLPDREASLEKKERSPGDILAVIRRRDVLLPALLAAVTQYVIWSVTFGFLPILARQYGASEVQLSILTSLNIAILMVGSLLLTVLIKSVGAKRLLCFSFLLSSGGVLLAALAGSLAGVFVSQACLGLAAGFSGPMLMGKSIEKVENAQRSTAMGLHQAVYAIGMFSGPWLSGILAEAVGIQPMFAATAAASLVLGLAGLRLMRE